MEDNGLNIIRVDLATNLQPIAKYKNGKDYIYWGEQNNYPQYLIELYKRDSIHGAIVKGKTDYVFGKGLTYNKETLSIVQQAVIQNFLNSANDTEDWNDIYRSTCAQFEMFDGFAWQIVWTVGGKPKVYCMQLAKLRRSADGSKFFYCEKWVNEDGSINSAPQRHPSYTEMDAFNPNVRTGTQIYFYKTPTIHSTEFSNLYPEPNYLQCVQDIETNIEITNHSYNTVVNGMSASSIVTFFNGEPPKAEKKKIAEQFKGTHTGTNNAGKAILNFANKDAQPAAVTPLTPADAFQQYQEMAKRVQQNIFTGHNANPVLFGIQTDNGISNPTADQILVEWNKFIIAYVEGRQKHIVDQIIYIGSLSGTDLTGLEVEQLTPLQLQLPLDNANVMALFNKETLTNYVSKKYGVEIINPVTDIVQEGMVNENIKNLTGRQWQNINRIKNNLSKGKIDKAQAKMLLKSGYGLSDGDIETLLVQPVQNFNSDKTKAILALFDKYAIDDNDDEIVSEEFVCSGNEALKKEFNRLKFETQIDNKVLEIVKGAPETPADKIAKMLGTDVDTVNLALQSLLSAGLISYINNALNVTEAGLNKDTRPVITETYTVYKYVTREDVPSANQTRDFCRELLAKSNNGRRWTREAIDKITNEFGDDAWTYRGGFYTNPNTGETTPFCRHSWKSIVKARKKK